MLCSICAECRKKTLYAECRMLNVVKLFVIYAE
jgi:hypothetical protein